MKIALEALVHEGNPVGLGYYALSLLKGLEQSGKQFDFFLFDYLTRNFQERINKLWLPKNDNFERKFYRFPKPLMDLLEGKLELHVQQRWLKQNNVDIYHGMRGVLPPIDKSIKKVLTVHAIAHIENPDWYWDKWYKRFGKSLEDADRIITVSQFTADQLIKECNVDQKKIRPIHNALNPNFRIIDDEKLLDGVRQKYSLSKDYKYFTFVGGMRPVKNLKRIISAFKEFSNNNKDYRLLIIGKRMYKCDEMDNHISSLNIKDKLIFTGYVTEDDLIALLNLSDTFIFTTLYEGFGYPAIEAMACGLPVLSSNVSSLPEVCGDAALLVDPYSVEDIFSGMEKLTNNDHREKYIQKGLERINEFSFEKFIKKHIKVYEEIAAEIV